MKYYIIAIIMLGIFPTGPDQQRNQNSKSKFRSRRNTNAIMTNSSTSKTNGSMTTSLKSSSSGSAGGMNSTTNPKRKFTFDETTIIMALVMVLMTVLIITIAMFKLAGSISMLADRLYRLEEVITQYTQNCMLPPLSHLPSTENNI